jgi:hypothetical protein
VARTDIKATLDLDSSAFTRGIQRARNKISEFKQSAIGNLTQIAAGLAGVGLVKNIINLGTAAAETASKFEAVFGPAAAMLNEEIERMQETIPASRKELQEAIATFGAMAKAFGLNEDAAAKFSTNMVKIAGDLASFNNLKPEEAFLKIRSAISGEFEPLKQLGIIINETILKQEALTMGVWNGTGAMNAAQKAMVVQSILLKQMGVATGDAAATSDSAANKIKFLQAKLKDMGAGIGEDLLPAVIKVVGWLGKLIELTQKASEFVGMRFGQLIFGVSNKDLKEYGTSQEKVAKNEKDITENQTDPKRLEAAEEYKKSLEEQLTIAGELSNSIAEATKETKKLAKESDKIDSKTAQTRTRALKQKDQPTIPPVLSKLVGAIGGDLNTIDKGTHERLDQLIEQGVSPAMAGGEAQGISQEAMDKLAQMFPDRFAPGIFDKKVSGGPSATDTNQALKMSLLTEIKNSIKTIEREFTA